MSSDAWERAVTRLRDDLTAAETRCAQLEEENTQLLRDGINGFLDSGAGSDMDEALDRLRRKAEKRIVQLEEALRFYADRRTWEWKLEEFPGAEGVMHRTSIAEKDDGKRARGALSSEAPEKEE